MTSVNGPTTIWSVGAIGPCCWMRAPFTVVPKSWPRSWM
jgi:hypothetical protein